MAIFARLDVHQPNIWHKDACSCKQVYFCKARRLRQTLPSGRIVFWHAQQLILLPFLSDSIGSMRKTKESKVFTLPVIVAGRPKDKVELTDWEFHACRHQESGVQLDSMTWQ